MKKGILFFKSLLLKVSLLLSNAVAQDRAIEYKIKAAYLYNFTKFITWPDSDAPTFNICIVGKDPFGKIISPIETRSVKNKPIRVVRFNSLNQAKQCQLIYSAEINKKIFPGILTIQSLYPILTVSDSKQFVQKGGMIAFILKEGKVKLFINLPVLRKSGLEISAKLLEVAELYEGESND